LQQIFFKELLIPLLQIGNLRKIHGDRAGDSNPWFPSALWPEEKTSMLALKKNRV
jgi:hypothetical protein